MLQVKNIYKEYKTGNLIQKALNNVSLTFRDNEFVAILGPSGSGKTTLLNIIGGLDKYDKGDLIINEISTKKYKDRDWDSYRNHTIGFVFQSYNLISHQTILANVELALTISGVSKSERKQKALDALEQVGLKAQAHKKPNQLSGGQMQRVAIARALVNDPDILLADEPTGALDTNTSVQVMDLLKEVAKDRLVIMVTHNPDLASEYATRIVNLKDGVIKSDSNPYKPKNKNKELKHDNMGKTSMSFLTSLFLSFNNLKTKKGRTILTAFAGSIGIIGIALILSLSNGVNTYIRSIEEETLSTYPLQIRSTGFDMTSMIMGNVTSSSTKENADTIEVSSMVSNMFSSVGTNDLASLKEYLESEASHINDFAKTVEYIYNVTPKIYNTDLKNLRQINPDISFSGMGMGSSVSSNSLMSSMMSTNIFYELPNDTSLYESQYDVKAGTWPTAYNEIVVVLNSNGDVSDFMLYALGLRSYEELDDMVEQFVKEEPVDIVKYEDSYSYEDILGTTFKLVMNSDCYEYDKTNKLWVDKSNNTTYMKNIVKNSEELKIVGIVEPKEGVNATMLYQGLGYTPSLTNYIIEKEKNSKIVKEQLENPEKNVFTGKKFSDTKNSALNMNSLMKIDQKALKSAFKFDASKIQVDFDNLSDILNANALPTINIEDILKELEFTITDNDMKMLLKAILEGYENYLKNNGNTDFNKIEAQLEEYLNSKEAQEIMKKEIEEAIRQNGSISITSSQMQKIMISILKGYEEYARNHGFTENIQLEESLTEYLQSDEVKVIIANALNKILTDQNLQNQIANVMNKYMERVLKSASKNLEKEITSSFNTLGSSLVNAFSVDEKAFAKAFKMNMSEEELGEVFATLMSTDANTYENNLKKLNYADLDDPAGINLYPKDFESNEKIINLLDDYNHKMEENEEEDKVISYTDMVGTLMSSVTTIIDVVSYVLIAFVSISLIVSSIMIGIITYISVLERKKEIGILRAIGASKRNISQVFNAETFIIGLLAGVLGIVVTLLFLIPINQVIRIVSDGANVRASLPIVAGIILIALSTVLTLIGGIIPSKKAAKEDPVLALRAE